MNKSVGVIGALACQRAVKFVSRIPLASTRTDARECYVTVCICARVDAQNIRDAPALLLGRCAVLCAVEALRQLGCTFASSIDCQIGLSIAYTGTACAGGVTVTSGQERTFKSERKWNKCAIHIWRRINGWIFIAMA